MQDLDVEVGVGRHRSRQQRGERRTQAAHEQASAPEVGRQAPAVTVEASDRGRVDLVVTTLFADVCEGGKDLAVLAHRIGLRVS